MLKTHIALFAQNDASKLTSGIGQMRVIASRWKKTTRKMIAIMITNNISTSMRSCVLFTWFKTVLLCTFFLTGSPAFAKDDNLVISQAWVRATVPGQEVSGAFMNLTNPTNAMLIKAESPIAEIVEIHSMSMRNGVMEMREVMELELPAGKTVQLAPGGFHIMLINLTKQLKPGDTVPIKLTIKSASNIESVTNIKVKVR